MTTSLDLATLWSALTLQAGYNAALVGIGALLLGAAAGATGALVFLRRRALISDAVAHATLPGIGGAFLVMVFLGQDGRWLPGLLAGSALSALLGLWCVDWMGRHTRPIRILCVYVYFQTSVWSACRVFISIAFSLRRMRLAVTVSFPPILRAALPRTCAGFL